VLAIPDVVEDGPGGLDEVAELAEIELADVLPGFGNGSPLLEEVAAAGGTLLDVLLLPEIVLLLQCAEIGVGLAGGP
jgi:hypothetical protein